MSRVEILGQERAVAILHRFLASQAVPPAFFFKGPAGIGKAMVARRMAQALVCETPRPGELGCGACAPCAAVDKGAHADVLWVDAEFQASWLGSESRGLRVETVRHVLSRMALQAMQGGWKVAVIEDAHLMEPASANALLKMLEEPLPRTLWILIGSQPERLPKTVLSRCLTIPFAPLRQTDVASILEKNAVEPGRARLLAGLAEGSPGRALELHGVLDEIGPLLSDRGAAATAADILPKELAEARADVSRLLWGLAQSLRPAEGMASPRYARFAAAMGELAKLKSMLESNVSPGLVLTLAVDAAQGAR